MVVAQVEQDSSLVPELPVHAYVAPADTAVKGVPLLKQAVADEAGVIESGGNAFTVIVLVTGQPGNV